ncbi:MAG: hypothetical protein ABIH42_07445, partial [Planctomycetota bacterium]
MPRFFFLILGLVAGIGHLAAGKRFKGVIFFSLFITFVNITLIGKFVFLGQSKELLFWIGIIGVCIVWLFSYV